MNATDLQSLARLVADIPDPEIPALTLEDLGILRAVDAHAERGVRVTLTPTYSGCPATVAIAGMVREKLQEAGLTNPLIELTLSPAWTSDWISAEGRRKLRDYGIAPPACSASVESAASNVISLTRRSNTSSPVIACPQCDSIDTERLSEYGSTPCKALYRCMACKEPFDYFKPY